MEEKRLKLEEASEGLRKALQDCESAVGEAPDGTIYTARIRPAGFVRIERKPATEWITVPVPEPAGVVWQLSLPDREPDAPRLKEVSEGLRKALEQGHLYGPNHRAIGVGPDGTRYSADAYLDLGTARGFLGRERHKMQIRDTTVRIAVLGDRPRNAEMPEPAGVAWRPVSADEKPVTREALGEGLRKALEGSGAAEGVAPDGMRYRAFVRDGLVFIQEDLPAGALTDCRVSEPAGVVWKPNSRDEKPVALVAVSEGLRKTLAKAPRRIYDRRFVEGVGPDGAEYKALLDDNLVTIDQVFAGASVELTIPEPAGVAWTPLIFESDFKPLRLEDVSEGLRNALEEGRGADQFPSAVGIGTDGTRYDASIQPDGSIWIRLADGCGRISVDFSEEPEGVVWRSSLRYGARIRLEEVSEGLRNALEEALCPDGRRLAAGVGPDGMTYRASRRHRFVYISETVAGARFHILIPEPEGVDWKPSLTKQEWVKLADVGEGLGKALRESRQDLAVGEGADGTRYSAYVWRRRLVFIYALELARRQDLDDVIPLPEPAGVAWQPIYPGQICTW